MTTDVTSAIPSAEVASKSLWVGGPPAPWAAQTRMAGGHAPPQQLRCPSGAFEQRSVAGLRWQPRSAPPRDARSPLARRRLPLSPPPRHTSPLRPAAACLQVGDLQPWMDESFLYNIFVGTNQLVSVKLIRNRATGASEGAPPAAAAAAACLLLSTLLHCSLSGARMLPKGSVQR